MQYTRSLSFYIYKKKEAKYWFEENPEKKKKRSGR
jgi:hypothetical protein